MTRLAAWMLAFLLLSACNHDAVSQENPYGTPPQRVVPEAGVDVQDDVARSRRNAITRAVEAATPAVVSINVIEVQQVRDPFGGDPLFEWFFGQPRRYAERQVQGVGSGFIISPDGYIVTNDHVAGDATQITVALYDGRTYEARLVGTDRVTDLALLKVEPDEPLPYLAFAEDGAPIVGEWAIAIGNPFGLFQASDPTVTVGVVSASGRDLQSYEGGRIYRDMIQTDAAINRGNSGGPLINALGEVIGVNTAIYSESGGSIGLGFAVPADRVRRIIDELRTHGRVERTHYDGLTVVDAARLNPRIVRALQLPAASGVFVQDLDPGSPAAQAGIEPYDVIVAIEGEAVTDRNSYVARIFDFQPGDTVRYRVIRDGEEREVALTIGRARQ